MSKKPNSFDLGAYIKKVIRDYDLTQKEVADKMGVTPVSVMSMINGNPKLGSLKKMADAIGADLLEFFVPMSKDDKEFQSLLSRCALFDTSDFSPLIDERKNKKRASVKDTPVKTASEKAKDTGGEPAV